MPAWRDCKLGDLLEIKHGYAFLGKHFVNAGSHIVLTPGSFYDEGGFKDKAEKEKWYNGPIPTEYVLDAGDIIVAMTEQAEGLLGSSAIIPRSGVYLHNQRLGLVRLRDESKTDKRFVYYLFNTKSVRQQIRASASGVKIRHTAPTRIAEVRVGVPPFPAQRRIASILSSYDDLIENNTRRIKILEEMAQMIYREWFVDFRFPGHENVKTVESELGPIPVGWDFERIGHVCEILGGGTPATGNPQYWENGDIDWYSPSDLTASDSMFVFGSSKKITELGLNKSSARLFAPNSVMMTSRATIGVVAINRTSACTNQGFITCIPVANRVSHIQIYFWLLANGERIKSLATGATFKEINKRVFRELPILVASQVVNTEFVR
jgi:type I restriction enzyme, S subunit